MTGPSLPGEDLLTPRQVAEILGVRVATVGVWARIGALKPALLTPGGHRRYRRADVEVLRDSRRTVLTAERLRWEQDAVRLYEQGWSIRQVAARFDTGYGAMRRVLLRRTTLRRGGPDAPGAGGPGEAADHRREDDRPPYPGRRGS